MLDKEQKLKIFLKKGFRIRVLFLFLGSPLREKLSAIIEILNESGELQHIIDQYQIGVT